MPGASKHSKAVTGQRHGMITRSQIQGRGVNELTPHLSGCSVESRVGFPIHQFPEEVWRIILEKLSPAEAYACYQSCRCFQQLLEPHRKFFFLALVVPHMFETHRHIDAFKTDLLNCRLVCRQWKEGVDAYFQSVEFHLKEHKFFENWSTSPWKKVFFKAYVFESQEDFEYFGEAINVCKWNPIISRGVIFDPSFEVRATDLPLDEEADWYWKWIEYFLEFVGEDFWYCSFKLRTHQSMSIFVTRILGKLGELMPNLKILSITTENFEGRPSNRRVRELMRMSPLSPMPAGLMQLRVRGMPSVLRQELLRQCNNDLLRLELHAKRLAVEDFDALSRFSNLTHIYLPSSPLHFSALQMVTLQPTHADFLVNLNKRVTFRSLFEGLQRSGAALKKLKLTVIGNGWLRGTSAAGDLDIRLQLPNLISLQISLKDFTLDLSITSLDFLEDLKELEYIILQQHADLSRMTRNEEERILFSRHSRVMEHSNLWDILPKLKRFSLTDWNRQTIYERYGSPPQVRAIEKKSDLWAFMD